jgi:Ca-activated chloride channel family protein
VRPLSAIGRVLWCIVLALLATLLMLVSPPSQADAAEATKTESPYLWVDSRDPTTDRLPLKSTQVDVRIAGVIADVTVTQHYRNEGQRAIEARYVFPGSTRAAVHAMNVRLGERLITARIRERQQARIEYDNAKKQGKTGALLEQRRPHVFEMNVANIMPGDEVAVELRYTELLTRHEAQYGFVFPSVVGPRYNSPQGAAAQEQWVATPHLPAGSVPAPALTLKLTLDTPVAVKEIVSPSHEVLIDGVGSAHARVMLSALAEAPPANRDFILNYRLAGDGIESGLMLYRGEDENFFLALVRRIAQGARRVAQRSSWCAGISARPTCSPSASAAASTAT